MGVRVARLDVEAPLAGDRNVSVLRLTVTGRAADHQFLSRLELSHSLLVRVGLDLPVVGHLMASLLVECIYYTTNLFYNPPRTKHSLK
jgi:hypothetical protein